MPALEKCGGDPNASLREAVLAALDEQGLLGGSDVHTHTVPHCYRCHTVVEPRLSEQWFVKMKPLAAAAIEAVQQWRFEPARRSDGTAVKVLYVVTLRFSLV